MRRRELLLTSLGTSLVSACSKQRYFNIGWDEDVQLHDGRVIVVTVKYTFERIDSSLSIFDEYGRTILRATDFSFDPGPPIGRFEQLFKKERVDLIEYYAGKWYLLLETRGGEDVIQTKNGLRATWGRAENGAGQKCWRLDDNGFNQASIGDLPEDFLKINIVMDNVPIRELESLNGTHVSLTEKKYILAHNPLDLPELRIDYPRKLDTPTVSGSAK